MVLVGLVPAYSSFTNQLEENAKRTDLITNLNKKLEDSKTLTQAVTDKESVLGIFNSAMPKNMSSDELLTDINNLVSKNSLVASQISFPNVELVNIDYKVSSRFKTDAKVKALNFSLDVTGNQEDLINFIQQLEDLNRVVNVKALSFSKIVGGEQPFRLSLTCEAFYYSV